mgnify:CR=1 FL=1
MCGGEGGITFRLAFGERNPKPIVVLLCCVLRESFQAGEKDVLPIVPRFLAPAKPGCPSSFYQNLTGGNRGLAAGVMG